jgi:hypothetical protein
MWVGAYAFAAEVKPFAREDMASDAVRLADTLHKETAAAGARLKGKTADEIGKAAAVAEQANDFKAARFWRGAAVAADVKSYAAWLSLAKLGAAADDAQANGRWEFVETGATAAYAAYERATGAEAQAEALAQLGGLLARHENWRPALDAYVASLQRRDYEDVR